MLVSSDGGGGGGAEGWNGKVERELKNLDKLLSS